MENHCRDLYYTNVDEEFLNYPEETIIEVMEKKVSEKPDFTVMWSKSQPSGKFDISLSMKEYFDVTRKAAKGFIKLGLEPKSSVGILGFNHMAWVISQMGCIFAGGMACGIYTTNTAEVCKYIMNHCNCEIVVLENTMQLNKILSVVDCCPQLKAIVQYTGSVTVEERSKSKIPIYTWLEFMDLGSNEEEFILNDRMANISPRDAAVLIYTSGTTGMPKGVMLSHDNILSASKMIFYSIKIDPYCHSVVSYLPLSHIAANIIDIMSIITLGVTVYFAEPDALKGSLGKTLKEVQPTFFFGVPRVFEKIQEQIEELELNTAIRKKPDRAQQEEVPNQNNVTEPPKRNIKKALGFERCTKFYSGAAPMTHQTVDYFLGLDIPINQVYGMSECSGPQTVGLEGRIRIGSTGSLIKGAELKIAEPDENGIGEICMKGRHIFLGYFGDEQKTQEVLDKDGWLHSGDLGKVEDNEFLIITGRIKELIVTAGGENIAPVPIEDKIKEYLPFISNAMLVGDKRKFISCLLTLKTTVDRNTQELTNELTPVAIRSLEEIGIKATLLEDVLQSTNPVLKKTIDDVLKKVNNQSISRAAFVQKWSFLPKDFSIIGGELGPTMKMKRPVITDMYAEVINKMYT